MDEQSSRRSAADAKALPEAHVENRGSAAAAVSPVPKDGSGAKHGEQILPDGTRPPSLRGVDAGQDNAMTTSSSGRGALPLPVVSHGSAGAAAPAAAGPEEGLVQAAAEKPPAPRSVRELLRPVEVHTAIAISAISYGAATCFFAPFASSLRSSSGPSNTHFTAGYMGEDWCHPDGSIFLLISPGGNRVCLRRRDVLPHGARPCGNGLKRIQLRRLVPSGPSAHAGAPQT